MRRKIELWIGESRADLSDQGLVLLNYAFTDIQDPVAVKNSYSKTVTLPGTATNAIIFGHVSRPDRVWDGGFSPLQRTPFTIYDETTGEILKSGYLKLTEVVRKGPVITGYKVQLFGGLGSFFYGLSYDDEGDKLTLADLDYGMDLDFAITAANVQSAWNRIYGAEAPYNSIWDIINFAPAYNGIPEGEFSADKAIAHLGTGASDLNLPTSMVDGDTTYSAQNGNALINLSKHTEWDMKDLRCYLQRPVLSMRAFLVAVSSWASANGYAFDYSGIPSWHYEKLWKTLPMIPSLGSFKQQTGDVSATYTSGTTTSGDLLTGVATLLGVTTAMELTSRFDGYVAFIPEEADYATLYLQFRETGEATDERFFSVIFVQLLGYESGSIVAASKVRCYCPGTLARTYGTQRIAELVNYTPASPAGWESRAVSVETLSLMHSTGIPDYYGLQVSDMEMTGIAYQKVRLAVKCYTLQFYSRRTSSGNSMIFEDYFERGMKLRTYFTLSGTAEHNADRTMTGADWASPSVSTTYVTSESVRSGVIVEKSKLLSSKHTPAEYLLGLAKQFGWVFRYDEQAKRITVMTRNDYFDTGEPAVDLSDMIDRSKEITITPCYAGTRIFEFAPEIAEGHFAKEYADTYGFGYGIQRVDTGYQFDSSPNNLLDKSPFRAAATILEHGPYWNQITQNSKIVPSVFLDSGNTYTLWASDGSSKEFDISQPKNTATIAYINESNWGYDTEYAWKLDLHDADGKPVDGEDILVYYSGRDAYLGFHLTDDSATMLAMNNKKPCWLITPQSSTNFYVANFQRYITDTEWTAFYSLDFGIPRETDMPLIYFGTDCNAYAKAWAAFMRDRYDQNTKVMKCRVHFRRLRVNQDLLRRFFFYEGAYWVLNGVKNYSMTTWDPVECEFIQVQDIENYTNGQILTLE